MSIDSHKNEKYFNSSLNRKKQVHKKQETARGKTGVRVTEEKKHRGVKWQGEIWNTVT